MRLVKLVVAVVIAVEEVEEFGSDIQYKLSREVKMDVVELVWEKLVTDLEYQYQ